VKGAKAMGKPKNDDDVVICNPPRGESDPEAVGLLRLQLAVAPEQRKTTEIERWMRQERALQRGSGRDVTSQPDNRVFSNNTIAELSGGHIHALRAGDVAGAESWSASQMYPVVIRRRIAKFCRRPANERTSVAAATCLIARRQPRHAASARAGGGRAVVPPFAIILSPTTSTRRRAACVSLRLLQPSTGDSGVPTASPGDSMTSRYTPTRTGLESA